MEFRKLTPKHITHYNDLMSQALQQFPADFEAGNIQDLQDVGGQLFGAFNDKGELIGAVGLRQDKLLKTCHKGLIWGLYVSPRFQGCGIGKGLLAAALAHARAIQGLEQLYLVVGEHNQTAQRLYHSLGFSVFGIEPRELKVDGRAYNGVHMWLNLQQSEKE